MLCLCEPFLFRGGVGGAATDPVLFTVIRMEYLCVRPTQLHTDDIHWSCASAKGVLLHRELEARAATIDSFVSFDNGHIVSGIFKPM